MQVIRQIIQILDLVATNMAGKALAISLTSVYPTTALHCRNAFTRR